MLRPSCQRGATLLVALILLVLMTLIAVTSFKLSSGSLLTVGNMQQREEALTAANAAIETAVSSPRVFRVPTDVFGSPPGQPPNTWYTDSNGDGVNDVTVRLDPAPTCVKVRAVPNKSLNLGDPDQLACTVGNRQSFGIEASVSGDSLCADSLWQIVAVAADHVTRARATVVTGVNVRIPVDDTPTFCPWPKP